MIMTEDMIMANIKMLRAGLQWTREHPDQAFQGSWVDVEPGMDWPADGFAVRAETGEDAPPCGSTLCLAGTIEYLFAPEGTRLGYSDVISPEGEHTYFKLAAQELAELTSSQAGALFISARNITDLEHMVDYLEAHPLADGSQMWEYADTRS